MGSLENGVPAKRTPLLRPSPSSGSGRSFFHRPRSRITRFLLFEKVDYVQWVCTAASFFFVVILFQAFLPASVVERSGNWRHGKGGGGQAAASGRLDGLLGEFGDLDFGEGIKFVPSKLLEKFESEGKGADSSLTLSGRTVKRASVVKPRLAVVLADLSVDGTQLQMVSIAVALREIGYEIKVFSLEDGPVRSIWTLAGFSVRILSYDKKLGFRLDWLNYSGVLVNSLEAKPVLTRLSQEPFRSLPVIWSVCERSLALRLQQYKTANMVQLIRDWKQAFSRATVVVFPNHLLPMLYSTLDAGNFFVLPGYPVEAWRASEYMFLNEGRDRHSEMGYSSEDFLIAIVGSQFSYSGMLLEHALVLQAISQLLPDFSSESHLKVGIITLNSTSGYAAALEAIALKFGFSRGSIHHIDFDEDASRFLGISDVVIHGSFLEEQSFPSVLVQAMCLGKLIIAPDLAIIRKSVDDGVNAYLFPKENVEMLSQVLTQAISNRKLSTLAQNVASKGKELAMNLMVSETVEGYAFLLEHILRLPSEFAAPKSVAEIPLKLKKEWRWDLFNNISYSQRHVGSLRRDTIIDKLEAQWNATQLDVTSNSTTVVDEAFSPIDWVEEKSIEMINARKRLLEEELKDRMDQSHGTWEDVYRNVKKADRAKNELHERDDRELERTGQPLCIYEPYYGEGTWPFLHQTSLYRGIGLSTKGRRPGADDIDASSRLPLLNNPYYRDLLGEYGAFFALANRVDRIHKNAWIGFQSWRAVARKASLTKKAETMMLEAIESRRHGDSLYFWVRMDQDPRNHTQHDFWSFCDAINAGNCRYAFSEALRKMYGMPNDWDSVPPMPADGDSWSVMYSWALPTKSFLEFVMFSRMFVDALDAHMYEEHHQSGRCYLSLTKDRHCYSRVLELLVNVWAYHSARRMIYVNPQTGAMQEQHKFRSRRGHMWIKWFSPAMLKSMDEELAEEWDSDHPNRRWLWPSTGEVYWQGIYERERNMRQQQKERRKQQSRDKIRRIKKRARQKTLGKYVKPPPEDASSLNSTTNVL